MNFIKLLEKLKKDGLSKREHGDRFERLIQAYLKTDPKYAPIFETVWMWNDFPYKQSFGVGTDTGIDLVALTKDEEFWAIQCKFYGSDKTISKSDLDKFLSASGRGFYDINGTEIRFSNRLFVSTTDMWSSTAEETIKSQQPPVQRISLFDLNDAPVDWKKLDEGIFGELSRTEKFSLRPHQKDVTEKALSYFSKNDRGKIIMACGTGKTFTSLRIAEQLTKNNGMILFLVPSIALLSQTLNEWSQHAIEPISSILICSDPKVSKKTKKSNDDVFTSTVDLALPASTNVNTIKQRIVTSRNDNNSGLTVVFSTYQSIDVLIEVHKELLNINSTKYTFDLTICDEAHRTTGVTLSGEDESYFVKVHDDLLLKSDKRLYMTATPRLFSEESKNKAAEHDAILASMDDEALYGNEIARIGFGEAVEKDLLTDYKVLILTMSEANVPLALQKMITNDEFEIKDADDLAKLIGSINALSKQVLGDEGILKSVDPNPMKRAVAFTNTIKNSNAITDTFNKASINYIDNLSDDKKSEIVKVNSKHIDGNMSAIQRNQLMSWLKSEDELEDNECRILTNVRCLSEGVDVPSLDAVMFLSARNSQVDVVQSVGRVMRKAPNKKYGYIIIPVVIPSDVDPNVALDNNERYKVVWTVLNALRAHDDRFNATINKIELNKKKPSNILVGTSSYEFDEEGNARKVEETDKKWGSVQQMQLQFNEVQQAIYAKMVKKVGDRTYWEQWANNVAQIAIKHVETISKLIEDKNSEHYLHFNNFLNNLQIMINPNITQEEAIEMISQHMITKPVFDSLFENYSFVNSNPISKALELFISSIKLDQITITDKKLQGFYESVRMRAAGIDNYESKQKIILELYERFFKIALPKQTEKLGIVYTPIEIVDFMINSAEFILNTEFNSSISDENVHVLDPFTGTGTFLVRLIQSEIIKPENIINKYTREFHGNEIVLLAYYIALINIEQAFLDKVVSNKYIPFSGLVLTDTFQMTEDYKDYERENKVFFEMFTDNNYRVNDQLTKEIRLIIGNPPYSIGQKSVNDDNKNFSYPRLDKSIRDTYSMMSNAQQNKGLYDSYVKAFRWASDRIVDNGVICFITNGSFIDSNGFDGFRQTLLSEFSSVYVLNLRGNARTKGELRKKEAGGIFGEGSRTQIAITILVKNKTKDSSSYVNYYEVDDYLNREKKLELIRKLGSIEKLRWNKITPDRSNDWISQRNESFTKYVPIGDKKNKRALTYFVNSYSTGIVTGRNAWLYNSSKSKLADNVQKFIEFYNSELDRCKLAIENDNSLVFNQIVNRDPKKINWTRALLLKGSKYKKLNFDESKIIQSSFRPFYNQWLYYDTELIESPSNWVKALPNKEIKNRIISVSGNANKSDFSLLISDKIQDLHFNTNSQAFPLNIYEQNESNNLFKGLDLETQLYGITDSILEKFQSNVSKFINKESIFYYVYGLLHSDQYRKEFANNLQKELPRIPTCRNFDTLRDIGRKLADLHNDFEEVEMYEGCEIVIIKEYYEVKKMKLDENNQTLIYNEFITISNIPSEAFEYKLAGRSALAWVVDRYKITVDKDSGILNDPNSYKGDKYIFELIFRIINLSIKTVKLIYSIPKLEIIENENL